MGLLAFQFQNVGVQPEPPALRGRNLPLQVPMAEAGLSDNQKGMCLPSQR